LIETEGEWLRNATTSRFGLNGASAARRAFVIRSRSSSRRGGGCRRLSKISSQRLSVHNIELALMESERGDGLLKVSTVWTKGV
jgi:hypothetical protein